MIDFKPKSHYSFEDFVNLVSFLRQPNGCPWDSVQTHQSIRRNFLEETYECCEALDRDDPVLMQEELGDVLMQVLFHADIEKDRGRFTLEDVCDGACKKLVFRHPNLFGEKTGKTWEELKAEEKGQKSHTEVLDSVARSLPALWRAEKLVKKGSKSDCWSPGLQEALTQLAGQTAALQQAEPGSEEFSGALGKLLFAAAYAGAMGGTDPEMALHRSCEAFIREFAARESEYATQKPCQE